MPHNAFAAVLRMAKERWEGNLQGSRSSLGNDKRGIPLTPLGPIDVVTIEAADVGKFLLRHG
jgi:hypothetical protein